MTKHQKTVIRTDEDASLPWRAGCSCGWSELVGDEKQGTKRHSEHRKASKPLFRLSRPFGGGYLFVKAVPPMNGDWCYTVDPNEAAMVDDKTRARYLRHLRATGVRGFAQQVTP